MWCPSVSLSVWANAWLAGVAAPDDVLDALSQWAPRHSVTAYDAVAAGTHRPAVAGSEPRRDHVAAADAADRGRIPLRRRRSRVVLPVPGDVRGLPAGTQFQRDAVTAGEAILVGGDPSSTAVGLVPDFDYDDCRRLRIRADEPSCRPGVDGVLAAATLPVAEHVDLGDAEYALRSAVRSAADALGALRAEARRRRRRRSARHGRAGAGVVGSHRAPDHAPSRALRVLENAAHVDAIITVSSGLMPIGLQSRRRSQIANDALRPLAAVVRSARLAAVSAILHSAWRR